MPAELPDELKHLISSEDFNTILNYATAFLSTTRHKNISFNDGLLAYQTEDEGLSSQINFLNLVKHILTENKSVWESKIAEYFNKLDEGKELEKEILADYSKAKEYLIVRLQPFATYEGEPYATNLKGLVYKTDLPETYSLLALDLPTRFHIVTLNEAEVWNQDSRILFEIGHQNLSKHSDEIEARKHDWDGATCYTLFDRDYSAAYCIDFANNCDLLIGKWGAIVGVPARGSVFIHPLSDKSQINTGYRKVAEFTNKFFDDEQGPISRNLYWFYENKFTAFGLEWDNGEVKYKIPVQLVELLTA